MLRRVAMFVLPVAALGYLGAAAWLDRHGRREPPRERYDAIVVLGCRVWSNGQASPALARRARHAARLYREGYAERVVFTGGVGDHPPSEASAAADVARENGVPERAIVLEDRSTSTEENASEAAAHPLFEGSGEGRVLVVSDAYHAFRAERVFRRHFREADSVGCVGTRSQRIRGSLREVSAVLIYAALGRM